ncbi:unnamed protein product [Porites evermanni]|uniref:C-type lectin domain-containing protein n=1 Tax=Porites evermanni TaxID=104178 RepID=A0ABN8MLJ6_9CNID|nr:unnamed protein product [Porites evermanni]
MLTHRSVTFSGIWTTETKCEKVAFSQSFASKPRVFASVKYTRSTKPNDAMYLWLENVNSGGFEVCLREFLPFDGKHQDAVVDWFAFTGNGSQLNFTITGEEIFPNSGNPSAKNNYGFYLFTNLHDCFTYLQEVPFNTTFYKSPIVILSVNHEYNLKVKGSRPPENNIISAWLEEVGLESMKVCVKDLSGLGSSHDPLIVSYAVTGEVLICRNTFHDIIKETLELIIDGIRAIRGHTSNKIANTSNRVIAVGFVYSLKNKTTILVMQNVNFDKFHVTIPCCEDFYCRGKFAEAPIVLVTSEHLRTGKEYDAALIWIEDVTKDSVKVCLREMQNFDGRHQDITVNWFAFSKLHKPLFTEHGVISFPNTNPPLDKMNNAYCQFVSFTRAYNSTPTVLLSANHSTTVSGNSAPIHNGITTWIENMNTSGFRACVKELYVNRYDPLSVSYAVLTDICEPGWNYFNGFCYFTSNTCQNWTIALDKCRQENSVLVDVQNNEENVFLQHLHNGAKSWLGLNDIFTEGSFTWADRGAGNFTAWAKNQTNNFRDED